MQFVLLSMYRTRGAADKNAQLQTVSINRSAERIEGPARLCS